MYGSLFASLFFASAFGMYDALIAIRKLAANYVFHATRD